MRIKALILLAVLVIAAALMGGWKWHGKSAGGGSAAARSPAGWSWTSEAD